MLLFGCVLLAGMLATCTASDDLPKLILEATGMLGAIDGGCVVGAAGVAIIPSAARLGPSGRIFSDDTLPRGTGTLPCPLPVEGGITRGVFDNAFEARAVDTIDAGDAPVVIVELGCLCRLGLSASFGI